MICDIMVTFVNYIAVGNLSNVCSKNKELNLIINVTENLDVQFVAIDIRCF